MQPFNQSKCTFLSLGEFIRDPDFCFAAETPVTFLRLAFGLSYHLGFDN